MQARDHRYWSALGALLLSAGVARATPPAASPKASAPAATARSAQPPAPVAAAAGAGRAGASPDALRSAEDRLGSDDPSAVRQAIDTLAQIGGEPAAAAVSARLRRGLPPQLIEHAIDALARIGKPSAGPVLIELTLHRRPQIRKRAIDALGALQVRSAQAVLLYALDDPNADVREAAVQALARTGTARALPALFVAAERGIGSALIAIGRIATARDVKSIMQRAKDGDVNRIRPALQVMLERSDFPMKAKIAVVRELALLGTVGARNHLVQWLDAWKASGDPRLRQALFDAIKRLDREQPPAATTAAKPPPAAPPEVASAGGAVRGEKP